MLALAIAHAPPPMKARLAALFELDHECARTVHAASEPIIAQVRLAWWRDEFAKPLERREVGVPLLERITSSYADAGLLQPLIDGWEELAVSKDLRSPAALGALALGRAECLAGLLAGYYRDGDAQLVTAARAWTLAAATPLKEGETALTSQAGELLSQAPPRFAWRLRSLAIIDRLSRRLLRRNGLPPLGIRSDVAVAARIGLTGR
jgi:phytoene synthase